MARELDEINTAGGKPKASMFATGTVTKESEFGKNDIKFDLSDAEKSSGGNGVPILKFPRDIHAAHKKYRSIDFYILKDKTWEAAFNKVTEAAAKVGTGDLNGALNSTKDILSASSVNYSTLTPDNCSSNDFHAVISLPIPNILTEEEGHDYDENNIETPEGVTKAFTPATSEISKYGDSVAQIGQQLVSENRRQSKHLRQIPVLNPFTWKKYKGSKLKDFRFTFFLVPRDKEEAKRVMQIVYTLKKYSYGSKNNTEFGAAVFGNKKHVSSEFFISAPPKVLMKFPNDLVNKMVNPGVCVISSISVTYQEGNTVGMTLDGVPRFVELQIALMEFNQRFQEDFTAN